MEFDFTQEVMKKFHVWVKLPNLPLSCWGDESLSHIVCVIGVPLYLMIGQVQET